MEFVVLMYFKITVQGKIRKAYKEKHCIQNRNVRTLTVQLIVNIIVTACERCSQEVDKYFKTDHTRHVHTFH
jgi:hypothetical protein